MALDNPTFQHPSRTSTLQSFDIKTHWQGPCRGCHHHHHRKLINIHISHDRNIQSKDFYCENCQKFLFCLGPPQRRWSLLSRNTDQGEDGEQSRACFDIPPDDRINVHQSNQSARSIDRSNSQSTHGDDRLSSHSNIASLPNHPTETSEDTAQSTEVKETRQAAAIQPAPATVTLPHNRRAHGFRGFARTLISHIRQPLQRIIKRTRRSQPPAAPNQSSPPHHDSSTDSDDNLSQRPIHATESMSAVDIGTQQESSAVPVLSSDDRPLPNASNVLNDPINNQVRNDQDGGCTDLEDINDLQKVVKIRDAKTASARKTASAKSQEMVCRCGPKCDCRKSIHGGFKTEDPSDRSASIRRSLSRQSVSESNSDNRPHDSRVFEYLGQWMRDQEPTERQLGPHPTIPGHRQSVATFSSGTTAAMSHDALELPDPPPRAPSPLITHPQSYSLLSTTSQLAASRSQLRLSTQNLAPGGLETVGEASSTSETSQNQRNVFDGAVNQQNPSQTNEIPANEIPVEHEEHPSEVTYQNRRSSLPDDTSERNPGPEASGISHANTF